MASIGAIRTEIDGNGTWRTHGHLVVAAPGEAVLPLLTTDAEPGMTVFCLRESTLWIYNGTAFEQQDADALYNTLTDLLGQPKLDPFDRAVPYSAGSVVRHRGHVWRATTDASPNQEPGADPVWRPISLVDIPIPKWPPAPDWDAHAGYAKGELVWYDDSLWRATAVVPDGDEPGAVHDLGPAGETWTGYGIRATTSGSITGLDFANPIGSQGTAITSAMFPFGSRVVVQWTDPHGALWGDSYVCLPPGMMVTGGVAAMTSHSVYVAKGARGSVTQGVIANSNIVPGPSTTAGDIWWDPTGHGGNGVYRWHNPATGNDEDIYTKVKTLNVSVLVQDAPLGAQPNPIADPTRWTLVSGSGIAVFDPADAYDKDDVVRFGDALYYALQNRPTGGDVPGPDNSLTWREIDRPQVHHALALDPYNAPAKPGDVYLDTDHPAVGWLGEGPDPNDLTAMHYDPAALVDPAARPGDPTFAQLELDMIGAATPADALDLLRNSDFGDAYMRAGLPWQATRPNPVPAWTAIEYAVIGGAAYRWDGTTFQFGPEVPLGGLLRHPVFSEALIRRWIAEAQRFQGTVQADGHTITGSIEIRNMVVPAPSNQGQYYIAVEDITGATITRAADPNHVPPIVGGTYTLADMEAGDWLISTGNPNDLTGGWARVPGGVLTVSLADTLYVKRSDTHLLVPASAAAQRDFVLTARPGSQAQWTRLNVSDQPAGIVVSRASGLTGELLWSDITTLPQGATGTDGGTRRTAPWPWPQNAFDPTTKIEDGRIAFLPDPGNYGTGAGSKPYDPNWVATRIIVSLYDDAGSLMGGMFIPDDIRHGGVFHLPDQNDATRWADYRVTGTARPPAQPGWDMSMVAQFDVELIAVGPGGHPDARYSDNPAGGGWDVGIHYVYDPPQDMRSIKVGSVYIVVDGFDVPRGVGGIGGKKANPGDLLRAIDTDGDRASDRWELLPVGSGGAGGTGGALGGSPLGTIAMWPAAPIPPGWLLCDGAAIDATLYPDLVNLIGPNVPDLRGQFVRGAKSITDVDYGLHPWTTANPPGGNGFSIGPAGAHRHANKVTEAPAKTIDTSLLNDQHQHTVWTKSGSGAAWRAGGYPSGVDGGGGAWTNPQMTGIPDTGHYHQVAIPAHQHDIPLEPAHTHPVIGGNRETAPDHVYLFLIIKATPAGQAPGQAAPPAIPAFTTTNAGQVLGVNPAGALTWVAPAAPVTELKPPVANAAALPPTGNADGDIRVTLDDAHFHIWHAAPAPGSWVEIGPAAGGTTLSNANPLLADAAAPGTGTHASREDHVHPAELVQLVTGTAIVEWNPAAATYARHAVVRHNGKFWIARNPAQQGEEPGVHQVWRPVTLDDLWTQANRDELPATGKDPGKVLGVDIMGDATWTMPGVVLATDEATRLALAPAGQAALIEDGTLVVQQDTGWTWRYQASYAADPFFSVWRVFSDYVGAPDIAARNALAPHIHLGTLVSVGTQMYQYRANPNAGTPGEPPGIFMEFGGQVIISNLVGDEPTHRPTLTLAAAWTIDPAPPTAQDHVFLPDDTHIQVFTTTPAALMGLAAGTVIHSAMTMPTRQPREFTLTAAPTQQGDVVTLVGAWDQDTTGITAFRVVTAPLAPATGDESDVFYNSNDHRLWVHDSASWTEVHLGLSLDQNAPVGAVPTVFQPTGTPTPPKAIEWVRPTPLAFLTETRRDHANGLFKAVSDTPNPQQGQAASDFFNTFAGSYLNPGVPGGMYLWAVEKIGMHPPKDLKPGTNWYRIDGSNVGAAANFEIARGTLIQKVSDTHYREVFVDVDTNTDDHFVRQTASGAHTYDTNLGDLTSATWAVLDVTTDNGTIKSLGNPVARLTGPIAIKGTRMAPAGPNFDVWTAAIASNADHDFAQSTAVNSVHIEIRKTGTAKWVGTIEVHNDTEVYSGTIVLDPSGVMSHLGAWAVGGGESVYMLRYR